MFGFGAAVPALAQECPQFFPSGQSPILTNPKLGQRITLLCNDAYAALACGVTHGAVWSAEHLTAASLEAARHVRREGEFHAEDRRPTRRSSPTTTAAASTAAT